MVYIIDSKPHDEDVFTHLEYFNEGALILLCYMMFIYSGIIANKAIFTENKVPLYISIGITAVIVVGNFIVMFRMSFRKIKMMYLQSKQKKK